MHVGRKNQSADYYMDGTKLEKTSRERDIGVLVQSNLRPSAQCAEAARRANAVLGQITRSFHFRDRHVYIKLYKQFVLPHMEFASPAWNPWTEADKDVLEKVQKRADRMVSGLRATDYKERLKELGMLTLEKRRLENDLIQTFKIMHKVDNVNPSTWFQSVGLNPVQRTRATDDPMNLVQSRANTDIRKNFFSQRVIYHWNSLPSELKRSRTVNVFKTNLHKLLLGQAD